MHDWYVYHNSWDCEDMSTAHNPIAPLSRWNNIGNLTLRPQISTHILIPLVDIENNRCICTEEKEKEFLLQPAEKNDRIADIPNLHPQSGQGSYT